MHHVFSSNFTEEHKCFSGDPFYIGSQLENHNAGKMSG